MDILYIIPARGQSKGLPGKNIKELDGIPMIVYTVKAALGSRHKGRVIVTTEDKAIAAVSKAAGATVIERPPELATDTSPVALAVLHSLDQLKKAEAVFEPEIIVLLQATSPLRSTEDIDSALDLFLANNLPMLVSVCKNDRPVEWNFRLKGKSLQPTMKWSSFRKRRQEFEESYRPNGATYIVKTEHFVQKKSFYGKEGTLAFIMPNERSIDIDNIDDFWLAEELLKKSRLAKAKLFYPK